MHDLSIVDKVVTTILYSNEKLNWETGEFDTSYLSNNYCYFELIEDNTIDIDSIEDIDTSRNYQNYELTLEIDKLTKAVKQLNKEIKELKEK